MAPPLLPLDWCSPPVSELGFPCEEMESCRDETDPDREVGFRKLGGISSVGNTVGICSPRSPISHKCIDNTNSSQLNLPSESMSERFQICAKIACGNLVMTIMFRACGPVRYPTRLWSVLLKSCVYLSFVAPFTAQSRDLKRKDYIWVTKSF